MLLLVCIALILSLVDAVKVNPMPAPQSIEWLDETPVHVDPFMKVVNCEHHLVNQAFTRAMLSVYRTKYAPETFEQPISSFAPFPTSTPKHKRQQQVLGQQQVVISVDDLNAPLQMGVNESYRLQVSQQQIHIDAPTVWGALHAISTLQQLIVYDAGNFYIEGQVEVVDYPLYPHRGVMIDTGRNFIPVSKIIQQIDIMSLAKLNVLHWHITDSQSWPLQLASIPAMVQGAYSSRETYSRHDVEMLVQYANSRGVRIIPEIDMPGHSRAGYIQLDESLLACQHSWWSNDNYELHTAVEPPASQLDILNDDIYDVVREIYNEVSDMFDDDVFHAGADELQANCYNFSTNFQAWIQQNDSRTYRDLSQYWLDHALPIFFNHTNRTLMMWEDILTTPEGAFTLPTENVILQSWSSVTEGTNNIKKLTGQGYDVVVSSSDHYYLDCGYGGWVTNDPRYVDVESNVEFNSGNGGSWCNPYKTWQRIYDYDFTANLTSEESKHVLGAEVALWSEQVDGTVVTQKIWPRSAALAEAVWSGNRDANGVLRTNACTSRILNFRQWLVALDYDASPLVPKYCLQNPHACDLYQNQTIFDAYS